MKHNTIVLKIWNDSLVADTYIKQQTKYNSHNKEDDWMFENGEFVKIRISNIETSGCKNKVIGIDELSITLEDIFGVEFVHLLNLKSLECNELCVKFHKFRRDIRDNLNMLKSFMSNNGYSKIQITFGLLTNAGLTTENMVANTKTYEIFLHNESGRSTIELHKIDNPELDRITILGEVWSVVEEAETTQKIVSTLLKSSPYGSSSYMRTTLTTLIHNERVNGKPTISYQNDKYLKDIRKMKLLKLEN